MKCRALIESEWYQRAFVQDRWDLSSDQNVKSYFQNTRMGFRASLSVGGKTTGYRGDCVRGDTMIATEAGEVAVARLVGMDPMPRVWTFNHGSGCVELKRVEATRALPTRPTVRVTTEAGRVLHCTDDHRIFAGERYVPAREATGLEVSVLRSSHPTQEWAADLLLGVLGPDAEVCLRNDLPSGPGGPGEGGTTGSDATTVLLEGLRFPGGDSRGERSERRAPRAPDVCLQDLRRGLQGEGPGSEADATAVLFKGVLGAPGEATAGGEGLPDVRDDLPAKDGGAGLLLSGVRERGPLAQDGWGREPKVQDGNELRGVVQEDAPADPGARFGALCGVRKGPGTRATGRRGNADGVEDSPHRREHPEQRCHESRHALPRLPSAAPQVEADAVRVVEPVRGRLDTVYDLQVEGNRNFFANGLLVHNCIVVDDPLNAIDAHSKAARDAAIHWWDQAMGNRLNDLRTGARVVIMQRLHEEDLSGHLLRQGGWVHLCLPTEFEPDRRCATPIGWSDWRTKPGELLFPGLFPADVIAAEKKRLGSLGFAGQHQQRPAPADGTLFKRSWWRRWHRAGDFVPEGVESRLLPERFDEVLLSVDAAFKDLSSSDYVAIGAWARLGPDKFLLDQIRDKLSFTETVKAILDLVAKYPLARAKLIEDKANGSAVIDVLKKKVPGIIAVNPEGGKEARAAAISPEVEAGNVFVPLHAPWVADYLEEHAAFPNGAHDDQVDQTTQALLRWTKRRGGMAALEALGSFGSE